MKIEVVTGNLFNQKVDAIVNPWNRNIIPHWLIIKQGIAKGIEAQGGIEIFKELSKKGSIPLGSAVLTTAGNLKYKGIIHVAGINMFWFASEYSIRNSVINSVKIAESESYKSIAIPLIGSGSGNRSSEWSLKIIKETLEKLESNIDVKIIKFSRKKD